MISNHVTIIKQITTVTTSSILSSSLSIVRKFDNNNGVLLRKISKFVSTRSFNCSSINSNIIVGSKTNNNTIKRQLSSLMYNHTISIEKISARVFCPTIQQSSKTETTTTTTSDDNNDNNSTILKGGNPITIFKIIPPPQPSSSSSTTVPISNNIYQYLTPEQCSTLAKSCQWESVFVVPNTIDITTTTTTDIPSIHMMFYMPTGESISFCAHAAMGGAFSYLLSSTNSNTSSSSYSLPKVQLNILDNTDSTTTTTNQTNDTTSIVPPTPTPSYVAAYEYDDSNSSHTISLDIDQIVWQQEPIQQPTLLHRVIREYHNVSASQDCTLPMMEVLPTQQEWDIHNFDQFEDVPYLLRKQMHKVIPLPTFLNSWIGNNINRKKTLIFINNEDALHTKVVSDGVLSKYYPIACDSIQNTSGLYFYARKESTSSKVTDVTDIQLINNDNDNNDDDSTTAQSILEDNSIWECRQFPRNSGYAEDPATGVAAAALAISLQLCEIETIQNVIRYNTTSSTTTIQQQSTEDIPGITTRYEFYQGTAMKQPSYIVVDNVRLKIIESVLDEEEEEEKDTKNKKDNDLNSQETDIGNETVSNTNLTPIETTATTNENNELIGTKQESTSNSSSSSNDTTIQKVVDDNDVLLSKTASKLRFINVVEYDEWKDANDGYNDNYTDEDDDDDDDDDDTNIVTMDQSSIQTVDISSSSSATATSNNNNSNNNNTTTTKKKDYRHYKHYGIASFTLIGRIEIDSSEMIEV